LVVALICIAGGFYTLFPRDASALIKHNNYNDLATCDDCHAMSSTLVEDNTSYLRVNVRSLPNMKALNGNRPPSWKQTSGAKSVGCTFCHYNTGRATAFPGGTSTTPGGMMDALEQFNGKQSQHPVDRTWSLDNATTFRNMSLSANTNTTRWMSNWDNSFGEPANQIGCTDCHDVTNTSPFAGPGVAGYPNHLDPDNVSTGRSTNPRMLRGGAASWNGTRATNSFCVNICHNGTATPSFKMGHYGWGAYDNTNIKESTRLNLRTSQCTDCHETHFSGTQKGLYGEAGETSRLVPSQATNLIQTSNCTGICHNDNVAVAVGHARPVSSSGISMGVQCIQCHDSSISHRAPTNPKMLFREDVAKATIIENLATNGVDDDYDGVIDNPAEGSMQISAESNCSTGSCHSDRHVHGGTIGGTTGTASCLHCHDMHGNGVDNNIRMIKSTILGKTVEYKVKSDYFRSDNSATKASLCDNPNCHAKRLGNASTPGTILGDVPDHASVTAGTDCSGCHSHTSSTGGNSYSPNCNGCHSPRYAYVAGTHQLSPIHDKHIAPPPAGYGYACAVCHYNPPSHNTVNVTGGADWNSKYSTAGLTVRFSSNYNPANTFGPTYNGINADNNGAGTVALGGGASYGNGACQGLYCHGNSQSARVWSGYTGAPTWNDNVSGACGTCHKVTRNTLVSTSHQKHVDNTTFGYGNTCNTCHYTVTNDGITIATTGYSLHVAAPAAVNVAFNPGDNDVKIGVWTGASKTCSNIYCHSTGARINPASYTTADNGAYGWPKWTDNGAITCRHCHGDTTRTDGSPNYPSGSPKINTHAKHVASGDTCNMCHNSTTSTGTSITTAAQRALHVNSVYNTQQDNAQHAFGYATPPNCTAIACHGGKSAAWGGATLKCADCHLASGDTDQYMTNNANWYRVGVTATVDNVQWAYSGHGRPTASGNYDCTANPPANFTALAGTGDPCLYCHDSTVGHTVGTNPFRLKNQTGVSGYSGKGWNATCLVCHSKTQTSPGYQPPGATSSANGTNGHEVDTAHDGTKHAADNSAGGNFCWDCHDAHGDRTSSTVGNIAMIQNMVLPKTDGLYGARVGAIVGENAVVVTFKLDNTVAIGGADWRRADFKGLCQVCHHGNGWPGTATTAKYYTQTVDNTTHNGGSKCTDCHSHNGDFGASCTTCHGDNANRMWPQEAGLGLAAASRTDANTQYNHAGEHLVHLTQIGARLGYPADNSTWSSSQQSALCLYCHNQPAHSAHGTAGIRAELFPTGGKKMMNGGVDGGTPTFVTTDNSCTGVQCHNRKSTVATYNWYTGSASTCDMCHTTIGAIADNNPRSGLHNPTNATKHDNSLPVGLGGLGGCRSCHWYTGLPAQSTTQKHIDNVLDNAAATINRPNMTVVDTGVANQTTCGGFVAGSGLDNAAGVGCHSDRGTWKRLWSTQADNTSTVVGSPRCNVCHGQYSTVAGSTGWRDNTSHWRVDNTTTNSRGSGSHDNATSPDCQACHPYTVANHENKLITMNDNGSMVADNTTSKRTGCSQCHSGVDYLNGKTPDNAHTFPTSMFPMQKVVGEKIVATGGHAIGANCKSCHAAVQGTRRGIQGEFDNTAQHGGTWANITSADCELCHEESSQDSIVKLKVWTTTTNPGTTGAVTYNSSNDCTANPSCLSCHNGTATGSNFSVGPARANVGQFWTTGTTTYASHNNAPSATVLTVPVMAKVRNPHGYPGTNKMKQEVWTTPTNQTGYSDTRPVGCLECHPAHGSGSRSVMQIKGKAFTDCVSGGIMLNATEPTLCWGCHDSTAGKVLDYWGDSTTAGTHWSGTMKSTFSYKQRAFLSTHEVNGAGTGNQCSICHNPHGASAAGQYYSPMLRGTWMTSPYYEDRVGRLTGTVRGPNPSTRLTPSRLGPRDSSDYAYNNAKGRGNGYDNGAGSGHDGYYIDENTFGVSGTTTNTWAVAITSSHIADIDNNFAGLCAQCHTDATQSTGQTGTVTALKTYLTQTYATAAGGLTNWSTAIHNVVKGWAASGTTGDFVNPTNNPDMHGYSLGGTQVCYAYDTGCSTAWCPWRGYDWQGIPSTVNQMSAAATAVHQFPCSKCHTPHASVLPKLMTTNCMDVGTSTTARRATRGGLAASWSYPVIGGTGIGASNGAVAVVCHNRARGNVNSATTGGWNKVTGW
jgi:predicted CxxxxCH...CXXCH cytochrome family protein